MPKHTPGPLTVSRDATPDYAPQFTLYREDGGRGVWVATVFSREDAELLAAAPEMLTLIRGFLEAHDTGVLSPVKDARALLGRIDA